MVDDARRWRFRRAAKLPAEWPLPELKVPADEIAAWRRNAALGGRPAVALAPGAVGPAKRWPSARYAALTRRLLADGLRGLGAGRPGRKDAGAEIVGGTASARSHRHRSARRHPGARGGGAAVSNDSGLLHVAAALGTPTIGIFGPTSPWHWAPLNPLAATIEATIELPCRPCHKPVCRFGHHRCMSEIAPDEVFAATRRALATAAAAR